MSWRIRIRHETGYTYEREVRASYNEARLTPASTAGQLALDNRLDIQPGVRPDRYRDYWGSLVHTFDVQVPHDRLVVTATSVVETPTTHAPPGAERLSWAELASDPVRDRWYEYLASTASVPADPELAEIAAGLRAAAATPDDAVQAAVGWVHDQMVYERGTTDVSTSAVGAWHAGRGVCQDFVHLVLAVLRPMGIPARYASGYFHPVADAAIGEAVPAESHAWAEAWTGAWQPFDPTNLGAVGERHVVVARARDYRDVAPLKGIYSGAASSRSSVDVVLTRLA